MMEFLNILKDIGAVSLSLFWFPIAIWTVLGLTTLLVMKYSERIHAIYQYHSRVALLLALPVGLIASYVISELSFLLATSEGLSAKFIVIQSPVTVQATGTGQVVSWSDPMLWAGLSLTVFSLVAAGYLLKIALDFMALRKFSSSLKKTPLQELPIVSEPNHQLARKCKANSSIAFSDEIQVPFTFGWIDTVIVFPETMKSDPEKFNMALRHELMHIKHQDYLLNNLLVLVKAVFWFHPLVHYLYEDFKEYREISCDSEVLADSTISKRVYAELLFELAPKRVFQNSRTVSMAVNPSTLKKRIHTMSHQTYSNKIFRSSIILALLSALSMTGIIACSDMQSSGITNQDVVDVQRNIQTAQADDQPLFIINGERMEMSNKTGDIVSRIKPEYIKSINVLKGQNATDKYGSDGRNGVLEIQLIDKELAFNDLLSSPPSDSQNQAEQEDFFVVVEEMPRLVGGLASIQKNIRYPAEAREAGIEGRVLVKFIVNEEGQVENPTIMRGIGGGVDEEALRVVKEAEFEPGMQRGKPVRVQYSLPLIFKLQGNTSPESEETSSINTSDTKTNDSESGISQRMPELAVVGYGSPDNDIKLESPSVVNKSLMIKNVSRNNAGDVSGKLVDADTGKPLAGANIVVNKTSIGTSTDLEGEFNLRNIPPGDLNLVISYVGYESATLVVNEK